MDKKDRKRLDVIHHRLQKLRQQLSGARRQDDEPGEVKKLEADIAALEAEAKTLRDEK